MNNFNSHSALFPIFHRLRQEGFNLGVSEYLDALKTVNEWKTETKADLQEVLKLLWCNSFKEQIYLEIIWNKIIADLPEPENQQNPDLDEDCDQTTSDSDETSPIFPKMHPSQPLTPPPKTTPQVLPLPFKTPSMLVEKQSEPMMKIDLPVSRRYMVYSWRYLRRSLADGVPDILDVKATVDTTAKQGFFLEAIYTKKQTNYAHLLLLVDREGSMTPFHRFTNNLVETAKYESTIKQVDVGYFHNVPTESIYKDSRLNQPVSFKQILTQCDDKTSVLIVSDAGAARGYRSFERIQATTDILLEIQEYTNLIAWLNPMPKKRWLGTSAQMLSYIVPMYPFTEEGLTQAIATIQGQLV